MTGVVILFAIVLIPGVIAAVVMKPERKRGCGRGCATCANYAICQEHAFEDQGGNGGSGSPAGKGSGEDQ